MNEDYLKRALAARVANTERTIDERLETIMRKNDAVGRLASGATLRMFTDECLGTFEVAFADAIKLSFGVSGGPDKKLIDELQLCGLQMIAVIMQSVTERSARLGISGSTIIDGHLATMRHRLEVLRFRITDDFTHGMQGSERLKKDPVVSIVQSNSPGALQQVGIGDQFSQTAFVKNHHELINAIDRALSSDEFAALSKEQKDAFSDIAAVVKEEAAKGEPDKGKLERWGGRLVSLAKELGMNVAAGEIVEWLGKIFGP
jgi:hypothetical protein